MTRLSSTCTSTRTGSLCSTRSTTRAGRRPTARARSRCSSASIHVDLSPLNDEQDLDEIAFAFEKVAHGVLAAA